MKKMNIIFCTNFRSSKLALVGFLSLLLSAHSEQFFVMTPLILKNLCAVARQLASARSDTSFGARAVTIYTA